MILLQAHAQVWNEDSLQQLKETRRSIPELWTTPAAQIKISSARTSPQLLDLSWSLLSPPVDNSTSTAQAGALEQLHGVNSQSVNGMLILSFKIMSH